MNKLRVYYDKRQSVPKNDSFSPSAGKPALVAEDWSGLAISRCRVRPLSASEISLAHDSRYVKAVLNGTQPNGFGNVDSDIARSLPYTTGSFVSAAIGAIEHNTITASLTSGFHHAGYNSGGGFCTFNGLMIAALYLKKHGYAKKVGILDLDMHYGNGTDQIINQLGIDWITHYTFGGNLVTKENSDEWVKSLRSIVSSFEGCDIVLYQAGADPHINDPLGGVLTDAQLKQRDHVVLSQLTKMGIPVAFNLAGGYQSPIRNVLKIHKTTAIESISILNRRKHG